MIEPGFKPRRLSKSRALGQCRTWHCLWSDEGDTGRPSRSPQSHRPWTCSLPDGIPSPAVSPTHLHTSSSEIQGHTTHTYTQSRRPQTTYQTATSEYNCGHGLFLSLQGQLSFLSSGRPSPGPQDRVGGFLLWSPEPSAYPVTSDAALQFCVSLWILHQDS